MRILAFTLAVTAALAAPIPALALDDFASSLGKLGSFKSGAASGGDGAAGAPVQGKAVQLSDGPPPAAPADNGEKLLFGPARALMFSQGGGQKPLCTILQFLEEKSSRYGKFDEASLKTKVDEIIANTEFLFIDYSCRDKLKLNQSIAAAFVSTSRAGLQKVCGFKLDDANKSKNVMVVWAAVNGANVTVPGRSVTSAIAAHEVVHLLLATVTNDAGEKKMNDKGTIHHGLLNFLKWGGGTPATAWTPAEPDRCKKKEDGGNLSAGGIGLSGGGGGGLSAGGDLPSDAFSDEPVDDVPTLPED
jgi:hypothetical protein